MTKKPAVLILCWTVIFLSGALFVLGQTTEIAGRQDERITIRMEKQALGLILKHLMEKYEVPIGFEQSILDRDHSDYNFQTNLPSVGKATMKSSDGSSQLEIEVEREFRARKHFLTVTVENGTLGDAMDQIVRQMENYTWEISDGVVNIFPIRGRDERFKNLLEMDISNFSLPNSKTVNDISLAILKLPEFGKWLRKNNLHFFPVRTGSVILTDAQYGRTLDRSMNFSNVNFRRLLNEVTKIKRGGWILKWKTIRANGDELIDIDI